MLQGFSIVEGVSYRGLADNTDGQCPSRGSHFGIRFHSLSKGNFTIQQGGKLNKAAVVISRYWQTVSVLQNNWWTQIKATVRDLKLLQLTRTQPLRLVRLWVTVLLSCSYSGDPASSICSVASVWSANPESIERNQKTNRKILFSLKIRCCQSLPVAWRHGLSHNCL